MNTEQKILKGAMILSISVMLSKVIGLIYRIPLNNIIGDEGNGLYASAYQVYVIILTLTATAIPSGLSKLIAEREAVRDYRGSEHIFRVTLIAGLACSLILSMLVYIGADVISDICFPNEHISKPIRVLIPTILIATAVSSLRGYFQGLGNMIPTAISQVIEQIIHVIFTVALAYYLIQRSLLSAVVGATIGTSIGAFTALVILLITYIKTQRKRRPFLEEQVIIHEESSKEILKKALAIILPIILSTSVFAIMTFIDLSMISGLLPESLNQLNRSGLIHQVPVPNAEQISIKALALKLKGQYSLQYNTFINIPISLVIQLAAASIPAIAASNAIENRREVNERIESIFRLGLIIVAPTAIAFLLFGKPIVGIVFSTGTGGEMLSAGAIGLFFIAIAQLSAAILQSIGKPIRAAIHAILACCIKVILNYVLVQIPELHIYGIIHSTTICYLIYGTFNLIYLYRNFNIKLDWKQLLIKPTVCSVLMGMISYGVYIGINKVLGNIRISMIAVIPFAIVIYLVIAVLMHIIKKEEIDSLLGIKRIRKFFFKDNIELED